MRVRFYFLKFHKIMPDSHSAVVVGLVNATHLNGAAVRLVPGTVVLAGASKGIVAVATHTGYVVHQPDVPSSTVEVPGERLELAPARPFGVQFLDEGTTRRLLPDHTHVKMDREWWVQSTAKVGEGLGQHLTTHTLELQDLIRMERIILWFGVLAIEMLPPPQAGCPMRLAGGGIVFHKGGMNFQYRLEDKTDDLVAYHFHGVVVGTTLAEVGWQRFDGQAPKVETPMNQMSVAKFTADTAALGVDKLAHKINMRGVW